MRLAATLRPRSRRLIKSVHGLLAWNSCQLASLRIVMIRNTLVGECGSLSKAQAKVATTWALAMVCKPREVRQMVWHRLDDHMRLPKVILGVKFAQGWRPQRPLNATIAPEPQAVIKTGR